MRKRATLIYGPQGTGKTLAAKQIAKKYRKPFVMDGDDFADKFEFSMVPDDADVVIVEDCDGSERSLKRLKRWITSAEIVVHRQHKATCTRPTPDFIVTTGNANFLTAAESSRRYTVIRLDR